MAIFSRVHRHGRWVDYQPERQAASVVACPLEVAREEVSDMEWTVFGVTARNIAGACDFEVRTVIVFRWGTWVWVAIVKVNRLPHYRTTKD